MTQTTYKTATVGGRKIFYREAGDAALPTIVLLHGFPTSSFMFRNLIPLLADRFHVIAPDYVGFGQSDAPSATEFDYTFDNLTAHVAGLIDALGLTSYILYMQDFGGPVGFCLFAQRPEAVRGFVIQNTNAYMAGVGEPAAQVFLPLWENRNAETEAAARGFLAAGTTQFQYLVGARDEAAISPDNWTHDQALLDRPGTDAYMLDLLDDYKTNVAAYDTWGRGDPFFTPAGAEAFLADLPDAKLVWLDSGHFVLDENAETVAAEIIDTFES